MALREKLDSNETSLYYAEETSIGVLPVTPKWIPLEPNSYDDFGGELTLLARNPINSSRQRKKGVITDLDASGGFNQDFTQTNLQDLLQGVMFADFRRKAEAEVTTVTGTAFVVDDASDFIAGALVFASGFSDVSNNGLKVVTGVAGSPITDVEVSGLVAEASPPDGAKIVMVGYSSSAGVIDVDASGTLPKLTGVPADIVSSLIAGEWIFVGGDGDDDAFATEGNNGFKRIKSASGTTLEIDLSQSTMETEANTAKTVRLFFGRVLKNELGALIKRRSYQFQRQLGAPDTANLNQVQSEYLRGSLINEFTLNIETADKINADISIVSIDNEQRTATQGVKTGTYSALVETDAFNTSTDFAMMRMNIIDPANENPDPLFAYLTQFNFTINNNITPNKAVGILGAFDVTAGTFEVSAEATAYFSTIEAVQAVRQNKNVEINIAVVKENAGFITDFPLIGLGDGRLDVSQDDPITLPLTIDAATAAKINPNTDYTLMWVFFDYLPNLASPE